MIIGPKINPSGPKNITPPKIENRINGAGISKPFPKKYAESMLSMKKNRSKPNNSIPIAKNMLPKNNKYRKAGMITKGVPSPGITPIIPPMLPQNSGLGIPRK